MSARHLRAVVAQYAESEGEIDEEILDLRSILAGTSAGDGGAHGA
jgi:hypothetical protein